MSEAKLEAVDIRPEPVSDLPAGSPIFRNITWEFDARSCDDSDYVLFRMVDADKMLDADKAAELNPPDCAQAVCTACVPLRTEWFTLPGEESATRTFGSYDTDLLMIASATHGYKIDAITRHLFGGRRDLKILDWGMGFGRVAMAIKRLFNPDAYIFGYDADQFNVDWAQANLPDIPADHCDFYPPLALPSEAVDFVYGFSVMTHLTEAAQEIWLRELRRILKPGGACLLTTRSDHLLREQQVRTPAVLQQLAAYGLSDITHDTYLGPKLDNKTYYRGTIQLREQVERTWSRYFDIVAYLPFGFRQDAVIMRKP
jgi:SAM-dependent methyltransferase